MYAYVGSRTTRERHARGEGLSVYEVEAGSGALRRVQLVGALVNPSYLALAADGRHLYCVHGDRREVSAFAVDRANGRLELINRQDTQGLNPVHLALDSSGRFLVVTNHLGASLAVLPVADDGALRPLAQLCSVEGPPGPHRIEQQQAKPHFNAFDPSGRWVVVPDKGLDRVHVFGFDGGRLRPAATPFVTVREGAGPRGAVFHPTLPLCYVVNELDSTLVTYRFDAQSGALTPLQWLPTLPASFTGNSRAAGIQIDAGGACVHVSNRGHDSLATFRLDAGSGLPTFAGTQSTLGRTPRFFTLSPDGRLLFALNEDSDSIVAFDVDAQGLPEQPRVAASCGSPVCMVFAQ